MLLDVISFTLYLYFLEQLADQVVLSQTPSLESCTYYYYYYAAGK